MTRSRTQCYIALVEGKEVPVEIVWYLDGRIDYKVDGRSSSTRMRTSARSQTYLFERGLSAIPISVRDHGGQQEVHLGRHQMNVNVYREDQFLLEKMSGSLGGASGTLKASMPGRVVALLKEVGATVEAGEPVLILEAMKMENQVKAPCSGVIREIMIQIDQAVESGATLMEIGDDNG